MTPSPAVVVSIPSPRDRQDEAVLAILAPVVRALRSSPGLEAVWFERVNKPDWGLQVYVTGDADWLERDARAVLAAGLGVTTGAAEFEEEAPEDKWTGGRRARESLETFHHQDTWACIEALDTERRGGLGSRAQFNLVITERLLDLFGLRGEARLAFYRRAFDWAIASGRWDAAVIEALEQAFAAQRPSLSIALETPDDGEAPGPWPGAEAARIGRSLVESVRAPLAAAAGDPGELAVFAVHSHSNRLGILASNEAALRYLVWRALGGGPAPSP